MKLLKRKIMKAQADRHDQLSKRQTQNVNIPNKKLKRIGASYQERVTLMHKHLELEFNRPHPTHLGLKNVAKNYGRAICNFILSNLSDEYLNPLVEEKKINKESFIQFIREKKETLNGIEDFRSLLLQRSDDSENVKTFRWLFQKMGEVFVKYFSVNWIFSGRLNYKMEYVRVRNKILRRIQNPEQFTYIR